MKNIKFFAFFLITVMLTVILPPQLSYAAETAATVSVDLSSAGIVKRSTDLLLGTNDDWSDKASEFILQNGASGEAHESFVKFFGQYGVPLANLRKGGSTSNSYDWMSLVGPIEERVASPYATNIGLPEIIKSALKVNPDAAFTAVINLNDKPEKAADLVRYLTLNPEDKNAINPNTGINWAQMRVDDGIENPVNIIAFELGNELYWEYCKETGAHPWKGATEANVALAATLYADVCKPVISAMRGVNRDVKISAISNSGAEIDGAFNAAQWWNQTVIEQLGDYCGGNCGGGCSGSCFGKGINFMSHHDYYFFGSTDAQNSKGGVYNASAKDTSSRISRYFGGRDIKILVTEQNMLYDTETVTKEMLDSHKYALRIADFINSAYNTPEIYSANHHGFMATEFSSYWGIGRKFKKDGKIYPTPAGLVLALMNEAVGGNVMKTTVNSNGTISDYTDAVIASAHLKPDGRLDLVILNRSETNAKNVSVSLKNSNVGYKLKSVSLLNGASDANNKPGFPESSKITRTLVNATENFAGYTVPAVSMAVLHLVPENFEFSNDTVGEISVKRVGNSLRVTDKLYLQNGRYGTDATAIVLKSGKSAENYSYEDICGFGQATISHNIAYFEIPLPYDFEVGEHAVIISGEDFSHYTVYSGGKIKDILFENADESDYVYNETAYKKISNSDYRVDIKPVFNDEMSSDSVMGATVVYGDASQATSYSDKNIYRVAYTAETSAINEAVSVYMPQSALSGVYTVILGVNSNGEISRKMQSFYFEKPDEEIMLVAPPHTANGEDISLVTDLSQSVYVDLKLLKKDSMDVNVFIGYYKEGKLISASTDTVSLQTGEISQAQLVAGKTEEKPDSAKLFIWKNGSNLPLMRAYAIR